MKEQLYNYEGKVYKLVSAETDNTEGLLDLHSEKDYNTLAGLATFGWILAVMFLLMAMAFAL